MLYPVKVRKFKGQHGLRQQTLLLAIKIEHAIILGATCIILSSCKPMFIISFTVVCISSLTLLKFTNYPYVSMVRELKEIGTLSYPYLDIFFSFDGISTGTDIQHTIVYIPELPNIGSNTGQIVGILFFFIRNVCSGWGSRFLKLSTFEPIFFLNFGQIEG